jgi:hypothetical protein
MIVDPNPNLLLESALPNGRPPIVEELPSSPGAVGHARGLNHHPFQRMGIGNAKNIPITHNQPFLF